TNASTGTGVFKFNNAAALLGTSSIVSLTVGNVDAGAAADIVAATTGNNLEIYRNNSNNAGVSFLAASTIAVSAGTAGQVTLGDLNGDGKPDTLGSTANATGKAPVLQKNSIGGSTSPAPNANPIVITSTNNGLKTGQSVVTSGPPGNPAANNGGANPA